MEILGGDEPDDPPRFARRGHFQILSAIFHFSKIFPFKKLYRFPGDVFSPNPTGRVAA
jgi:hypothetical protein